MRIDGRFSCWVAYLHVTFGGSGGIMTTARPELPYPRTSQAKFRDETSRSGEYCDVYERHDYANEAYHFLVNGRMVVYK